MSATSTAGPTHEKMLARYEAQLAGALSWLDAQSRDGRLCGPALTQADISRPSWSSISY